MIKIIPSPKTVIEKDGVIEKKIRFSDSKIDHRLRRIIDRLPLSEDGTELEVIAGSKDDQGYTLDVTREKITIASEGVKGAFYGLQTLRQLFNGDKVPCCHIEDCPDFPDRGVYHDITRGKMPKLETLKAFIDELAYYKINTLQLYVEQCYPFIEYQDILDAEKSITADEIRELDRYCTQNFIEFVPSIASFGHLYELLQKDVYKHLQVAENFVPDKIIWIERMLHHTIDPLNPESIEIIKSLIDQFVPLFTSNKFNICCDETFDLTNGKHRDMDTGRLYVDFVLKIIKHLQSKGKTVMMWGDIISEHPEYIDIIPEDVILLSWDYSPEPSTEKMGHIAKLGRNQLVCPGTWSWFTLSENLNLSMPNIAKMIEYGYEHGATGVLNTNWGDYGNPCSIELAMCGLTWGAEKSWNVATAKEEFYAKIDDVLYKKDGAIEYIKKLSDLQDIIRWREFAIVYSNKLMDGDFEKDNTFDKNGLFKVIAECKAMTCELESQSWKKDEYRLELIVASIGTGIMAELMLKEMGEKIERYFDVEDWLLRYETQWLKKNKESEFPLVKEMFRYMAN